jgi:spermidine synthase
MLLHPQPRTIFIGGGGEGATLREVLGHKSVTRAVMVDIDQQVVELCKRHLPNHHQGAFDDPRAQLRIGDARQLLAEAPEQFDVIVLDLADPIEGGPAYRLYTQEFYRIARGKLNHGGLLVTQSGPASPLNHTEAFTVIQHTLASVFPSTVPYSVFIPSFMNPWGFTIAALDAKVQMPAPEELDRRIAQRIARPLRFLDGLTCQALTTLPSFLRRGFAEERRLATDADPVFVV